MGSHVVHGRAAGQLTILCHARSTVGGLSSPDCVVYVLIKWDSIAHAAKLVHGRLG